MATILPTTKEIIESGNALAQEISHHPAIALGDCKKKLEKDDAGEEAMDVEAGDQLEQIEMANKLVAGIDDQVKTMYKAIYSKYSYRFPELKLANPMQYIMTAHLLANKPDKVSDENIKKQLGEFLEPKTQLLVTMSAATTQGVKLEPEEMERLMQACSAAIHLANLKAKLLAFVEKNMTTIAPNLSVILGAPIAAKLMGLAGGLMKLATLPACNIPILGSHKISNIETDMSAPPPRVGHIYECDLIQQIPFDHTKDVRKRAVKWVANKCVLAARCDVSQSDPNGESGRKFREMIEVKINKELEPPPKKAPRPLPAPIEKSGKKRGGKRVRRLKERYATTELRKAANRIAFGDVGDDAYQNDLGFGRSQLNAIQKLRGPQINEKTKIRLSREAKKNLSKYNQNQSKQEQKGETSNATKKSMNTTSIVLKPEEQELEIFNPKAKESYNVGTKEGSSYFSDTTGFLAIEREKK